MPSPAAGNKPTGAKLRESTANAVGEDIALNTAVFVGNLFEVAFLFVRRKDNVILYVDARLGQKVEDDEVLRHRFAGCARF